MRDLETIDSELRLIAAGDSPHGPWGRRPGAEHYAHRRSAGRAN